MRGSAGEARGWFGDGRACSRGIGGRGIRDRDHRVRDDGVVARHRRRDRREHSRGRARRVGLRRRSRRRCATDRRTRRSCWPEEAARRAHGGVCPRQLAVGARRELLDVDGCAVSVRRTARCVLRDRCGCRCGDGAARPPGSGGVDDDGRPSGGQRHRRTADHVDGPAAGVASAANRWPRRSTTRRSTWRTRSARGWAVSCSPPGSATSGRAGSEPGWPWPVSHWRSSRAGWMPEATNASWSRLRPEGPCVRAG